jgi:glycosyltransferase involved in cell wall biosynthesis
VTFTGHQEDVAPLYRGASCLVLPSVSHESFGIVIAEAMASGLPVITSDFGPLPEINVDGETGIVAPMGDTGALANAIRRLMEHPDDAERFGRNGMKRALERFSRQRTLEAMLRIYGDWAGTVLPR